MVRAQDLPLAAEVHHRGARLIKHDDNLWMVPKTYGDEWLCDRQVDYLLADGATVVSAEQATT